MITGDSSVEISFGPFRYFTRATVAQREYNRGGIWRIHLDVTSEIFLLSRCPRHSARNISRIVASLFHLHSSFFHFFSFSLKIQRAIRDIPRERATEKRRHGANWIQNETALFSPLVPLRSCTRLSLKSQAIASLLYILNFPKHGVDLIIDFPPRYVVKLRLLQNFTFSIV